MTTPAKLAITALVLALTAVSWTQVLDHQANTDTVANFKRALAIAALARAFNGVISVAQGTEVAIQPVGVGVTLTLGEILDPLNDLVERFAGLALVATVSLGLQIYLAEMTATYWLSGLMSVALLIYLIQLWRKPGFTGPVLTPLTRIAALLIFARFLLAVVLISSNWVNHTFLTERQDSAVAQLSATSEAIEELNDQQQIQQKDPTANLLDRTTQRLEQLLDSSKQALDIQAQLADLQRRVERSVEDMVNLIVIFLLQTLILPMASLWLCWWALRAFWHLLSNRQKPA